MSGYFRRTIANRIVRTLSKLGKIDTEELERLEKNIALLVRTQDVQKKTRPNDPHYWLDLAPLITATGVANISSCKEIRQALRHSTDDVIAKVQQEKDGLFIFVHNEAFYQHVLQMIQKQGATFGARTFEDDGDVTEEDSPKTVVVEYSSPNIAKPFHAGHLRSTIIGNFIANLYEHAGHSVHRITYLGDWGTQFGLLAVGFQRYGSEKLLQEDPLQHLFDVYVKVHKAVDEENKNRYSGKPTYREGLEVFSKLEKGDPELLKMWRKFRDLSIDEYIRMYQRLGVRFTEIQSESEFSDKTKMWLTSLQETGLLKHDDRGVGYIMATERGTEVPVKLVKSDGSSLYLARDVAAALDRDRHFSPDRMHYVVEMGQELHFRHLQAVLQKLGIKWADRPLDDIHIRFGRVEGMSSRRGTVVFLRDIIDEAKEHVVKSLICRKTTRTAHIDAVADELAVSAIIVQDLRGRRLNNYTFSWDRMLNFTAESGIFMQYAHARLCSLIDTCGIQKTTDVDFSCLLGDEVHQLLLLLARYPEVIEEAFASLEPCTVVQYLLKLCRLTNAAYSRLPVRGQDPDVAQARLLLFDSSRQVLASGLQLIGLQPLKEM